MGHPAAHVDWEQPAIKRLIEGYENRHFLAPRRQHDLAKEIGILAGVEVSQNTVSRYLRMRRENPDIYMTNAPPTMVEDSLEPCIVVDEPIKQAVDCFVAEVSSCVDRLRGKLKLHEEDAEANAVNVALTELAADSRLAGVEVVPLKDAEKTINKLSDRTKCLFEHDKALRARIRYCLPPTYSNPAAHRTASVSSPGQSGNSHRLIPSQSSPSVHGRKPIHSPSTPSKIDKFFGESSSHRPLSRENPWLCGDAEYAEFVRREMSPSNITPEKSKRKLIMYSPSRFEHHGGLAQSSSKNRNPFNVSLKRPSQNEFGTSLPGKMQKIGISDSATSSDLQPTSSHSMLRTSSTSSDGVDILSDSDDDFVQPPFQKSLEKLIASTKPPPIVSNNTPIIGVSFGLKPTNLLNYDIKNHRIREYNLVATVAGRKRYTCMHCRTPPVSRAIVTPDGGTVVYDPNHSAECRGMEESVAIVIQLERRAKMWFNRTNTAHTACINAYKEVVRSGLPVSKEMIEKFSQKFFDEHGLGGA